MKKNQINLEKICPPIKNNNQIRLNLPGFLKLKILKIRIYQNQILSKKIKKLKIFKKKIKKN